MAKPYFMLLLLFASIFVFGETNDFETKFQRAIYLFKTNRFANSETAFRSIVTDQRNNKIVDNYYYQSLYYLALSISQQGNTSGVSDLLVEMNNIAEKNYGPLSFEVAKSAINLGEIRYREGNIALALNYLDKAELIANRLEPKPDRFLAFIRANRAEYSSGPFNKNKLPEDLSNFYSACENLEPGQNFSSEKIKLKDYSEVGVDFKPSGMWKEVFTAQLTNSNPASAHDSRVIFIPRNEESVYDEWCVVYLGEEKVVGFEIHGG